MFTGEHQQPDTDKDRDQLIIELKKCKALTAGFLGSVPGALIALDSQWRLVYLNADAEKLFDSDRAPRIGQPLEEVYPKKLGHILAPDKIRELLGSREKTTNRYASYLRKWFRMSASTSDFGFFVRLEDITAEMLVNRLLRLNEFSISHAREMVFWIKPGGHVIYANVAACDTLGYSKEELVSLKAAQIDTAFDDNKWAGFLDRVRLEGYTIYESSLRTKDGTLIPAEVTYNYLQYSGDEYLVIFARDITVRKKAENALNESKAEAELYLDLMSHDINNMNQIAIGYLELAQDAMRTEGKLEKELIEMISKPYEMLQNSSALIGNIRKIRREKAGHYKTSVMDLGKVIREVTDSLSQVPGRDIRIDYAQEGHCKVLANELLKDIFLNLIGNSIKHSQGPLEIKIKLTRTINDEIAYCTVSVEDNGPGISDEMKTRLFREISPEKAKARGKGLGLYLIKQLVHDFNGKFWVEDRVPGDHTKGARFVVMLPGAE